jgi:hypothetical protein
VREEHPVSGEGPPQPANADRTTKNQKGDLVAAYTEISWPPERTFVAAHKDYLMAADT